ncbi:MAG: ATP-binding protein [Marinovum sp.]|nr:ATP-binding protein [Marinovum sp.]
MTEPEGAWALTNDVILTAAEMQLEPSFVLSCTAPNGVSSASVDWVNVAFAEVFELAQDDLSNLSPHAFLKDHLIEFIGAFLAEQSDRSAQLRTALCLPEEAQDLRWYDLEVWRIDDAPAGHPRLFGRFVDVTERENLKSLLAVANAKIDTVQNRFEHAVNSIPEGFAMYDRDDVLVAYNSKYLELYKETAPAIKIGTTFESIMRYGIAHGQYPEAEGCEEAWLAERLNRENRKRAPVDRKLPGGRYLRVHEVENEQGDLVGLRSDVTHYHEQQQALEQKAAELAAANEEVRAASAQKERFFARMSHELRTPMNGILGMAEVLQHSELEPQQEVYLQTISSSASSLLGIINDILDYSKATEGKFTFTQEEFSLKDTVFEAARLLQSMAHDKNLDLWVEYPKVVPTHFMGDSVRVRQVLLNHLGNALKFTDQGHFGVRVGFDADGVAPRLKVSIEDTGRGIPEDAMATLFSAYEQVAQDAAKVVEGTGLGLAISKSLVDQMGGKISVESTVGQGTCFTVSLDLAPRDASEVISQVERVSGAMGDVAILGAVTASNTVLSKMLEDRGYRVHWIGSEDVEVADEQRQFQAVFYDGDDAGLRQDPERVGLARHSEDCKHVLLISVPDADLMKSYERVEFAATILKPARWEDFASVLLSETHPPPEHSEVAPRATAKPCQKHAASNGGVLVVDDNKTNRLVAGKLLETAGIEVEFACDGLEAVQSFKAQQPQTIFMDVTMPVLNGLEATRRIRQIEADQGLRACTVYALTANTSQSEVDLCLDAGVDGVIGKPVKRSDLIKAISRSSAML